MFLLPDTSWEIRTTTDRGRGVFARTEIEPGTVIGDYIGIIIRNEEEDRYSRKHGYYARHHTEHSVLFPDPNVPGVHLINHCCTPTCDLIDMDGHAIHYAARRIFAGEELTVDYGMDPRETEAPTEEIVCMCGSRFCRGTMCTSPAMHDANAGDADEEDDAQEDAPIAFGSPLPPLDRYPARMPDDARSDLFGSETVPPLSCEEDHLPGIAQLRRRIRTSGRRLRFPRIGMRVDGILRGAVVCVPLRRNTAA